MATQKKRTSRSGQSPESTPKVDQLEEQARTISQQVEAVKDSLDKIQDQTEDLQEQVEEIKEDAKGLYREARPWLVRWGRIGHAAKGIVYLALGLLILRALRGLGSPNVDQASTLRAISQQPFFGPLLLGLIAIGLAGYVLWQFLQAVADPQGYGRGARGLVKRGAAIVSGLSYAGLVLLAAQLILGLNAAPDQGIPDWTRPILGSSFGPWLIGLAGLGFLAYFFFMAYVALTGGFKKKLALFEMEAGEKQWAIQVGRIGLIGRGLLLAVIGGFLIQAAIQYNRVEPGGLGDILLALAQRPYGPWILGGVALGLCSYGFYTIILARYGHYRA